MMYLHHHFGATDLELTVSVSTAGLISNQRQNISAPVLWSLLQSEHGWPGVGAFIMTMFQLDS